MVCSEKQTWTSSNYDIERRNWESGELSNFLENWQCVLMRNHVLAYFFHSTIQICYVDHQKRFSGSKHITARVNWGQFSHASNSQTCAMMLKSMTWCRSEISFLTLVKSPYLPFRGHRPNRSHFLWGQLTYRRDTFYGFRFRSHDVWFCDKITH